MNSMINTYRYIFDGTSIKRSQAMKTNYPMNKHGIDYNLIASILDKYI